MSSSEKKVRTRLIEDGMYMVDSKHWEMFEAKICYHSDGNLFIHVPIDLVRHLNLEKGEIINIAIEKSDRQMQSNSEFTLKTPVVSVGGVKVFLDHFLASTLPSAEAPLSSNALVSFLHRYPEYAKKVEHHVKNYRKSNEYVWVERKGKETDQK